MSCIAPKILQRPWLNSLLPPAIRRMTEGYIFSLSTFRGGGSQVPVSDLGGRGPGLRFLGRGTLSQIFWGGTWSQIFGGGTRSQIFRGGYLVSDFRRGGNFFSLGKIFDTRFGLIHVQTGEKFFCQGTPPPHPVKGKIFDTRFGLIHVQTGKKFFVKGPPSKGKNF